MNVLTHRRRVSRYAGLAAEEHGRDGIQPPIVLLHGLTFDRAMWGPAIEELLQLQARRWRLAEIVPAEAGRSTLEYLIRLRDEFLPATLLDALKGRGTPPIDAAEYRSLRGMKKRKEE